MARGDLVLGITGASGAPYAIRLLEMMVKAGRHVHVTMSTSALQVFQAELGVLLDQKQPVLSDLLPSDLEADVHRLVTYHHYKNLFAGIASGSFRTDGMVICPCSMGTVAAIAHGLSQNLIHRAADVHLKEKRKLILVPRETPLGLIQLKNLATCAEAGALILPAMPAFYTKPESIQNMVDFVVARICDQLQIDNHLLKRWGTEQGEEG
ncbi:MAG: UbiX family flavin prenyltransferase [Planctomycetia bacterium]|nr:UbiX family flavin prenyltransferase [Planctomycetia bacterium]